MALIFFFLWIRYFLRKEVRTKLKELFVKDNQEVKAGDYLAVIDNPARTEDVLALKVFIVETPKLGVSTLPPEGLQLEICKAFIRSFIQHCLNIPNISGSDIFRKR